MAQFRDSLLLRVEYRQALERLMERQNIDLGRSIRRDVDPDKRDALPSSPGSRPGGTARAP
jgi:hypothetical protein